MTHEATAMSPDDDLGRPEARRSAAEPDRPFAILDAMALVGASAAAFSVVRPLVVGPLREFPGGSRSLAAGIGVLAAWTPAVLLLRLRGPRPTLRRLSRRPGFVATALGTAIPALAAAAVGLLATLGHPGRRSWLWAIGLGFPGSSRRPGNPGSGEPSPIWWLYVAYAHGWLVGPSVAVGWVLLSLAGPRRADRGWLDRLGRALGAAWIGLWAIDCALRFAAQAR